jgi:hypothetical protein
VFLNALIFSTNAKFHQLAVKKIAHEMQVCHYSNQASYWGKKAKGTLNNAAHMYFLTAI